MQGASACEQSLRVNSFLYKTEKRMVAATKWLFRSRPRQRAAYPKVREIASGIADKLAQETPVSRGTLPRVLLSEAVPLGFHSGQA
jgi:hypothetical protein